MKELSKAQLEQINKNSPQMQMQFVTGELQGLRSVLAHLIGDDQKYKMEAFNALLFIKSNYKQWPKMITWLKRNQLYGQKLVEFFQNESPDGGGYHMGATLIISRIEGMKHQERIIKIDELL